MIVPPENDIGCGWPPELQSVEGDLRCYVDEGQCWQEEVEAHMPKRAPHVLAHKALQSLCFASQWWSKGAKCATIALMLC
jgi:hypothetical protein